MGGLSSTGVRSGKLESPACPSQRIVLADPSAAAALLDEYSKKRVSTRARAGALPAPGEGPLLFVVQKHSARQLHI